MLLRSLTPTMALESPVFILEWDFEPAELPTACLEQQSNAYGNKQKREEVTTAAGTSIEAALYVILKFEEVTQELNFDIRPEIFSNF
jgi:hypothetical protein